MNISKELKDHFRKLPKFQTPDGITFYSQKDYDTYMKLQGDSEIVENVANAVQPSCDFSIDRLVLSV
jgi:hypothetical protein